MLFQEAVQNAQTTAASSLRSVDVQGINRCFLGGILYELRKERLVWTKHPSVCHQVSASKLLSDIHEILYDILL